MDLSRIGGILVLVLTTASAGATSRQASEAAPPVLELLELDAGSSFEFIAMGKSQSVLIPVRPGRDWVLGGLPPTPVVRRVALGSRYFDETLLQNLQPTYVSDSKGLPTHLKLKVDLETLVDPGTYDVFLDLTQDADAGSQRLPLVQRLKVQLVHPSATLAPVPSLTIEQVTPFPVSWLDSPSMPTLLLQETSQRSHVTRIQTYDSRNEHGPRLLPTPPRSVQWDAPAPVNYTLDGSFPVGSTIHGNIMVIAPQLSAPFHVPYSVRTRISKLFLLVILVLGVLASVVLRDMLSLRSERMTRRLQVQEHRAKLRSVYRQHEDAPFRSKLDALDRGLADAETRSSLKTLEWALSDATAGLKEALEELATRRQQIRGRIESLVTVLERPWLLPGSVDSLLQDFRKQAAGMVLLFERDDLSGAALKEEELSKGAFSQLRDRVGAWRQAASEGLLRLLAGPTLLPHSVEPSILEAISPVQQRLYQEPSGAESTTLAGLLESTHTSWAALYSFLTLLHGRLFEVMVRVQKRLRERAETDLKGVAEVEAQLRTLHKSWSRLTLGSSDNFPALDADISSVLAGLRAFIEANTLDGNEAKVKVALDDRRFEDAAAAAVKKPKPRMGGTDTEKEPAEQPPSSSVSSASNVMVWFGPPPTLPVHVRESGDATILLIEQQMARTWSQLSRVKLLEASIVSLLIIVSGYFFFEGYFTGTVKDFLGILIWTFGLDFSMGSLSTFGKKPPT